MSAAIDRLAEAANAFWFIDPERCLYFFDTLPDGNALTVVNSSSVRVVDYDEDLTHVRNRTTVIGAASQTSALVSAGATTIPVEDTSLYAAVTGQVRAATLVVTYTGKSVGSGPAI